MEKIEIRTIEQNEYPQALALAERVFDQFEAPDYKPQGVEEFHRSIYEPAYMDSLHMMGAFHEEKLVGIMATRNGGSHIALFFVDGEYHRRGIGKSLFQQLLPLCKTNTMTVNSSLYAEKVYEKLGFVQTGAMEEVSGVRFIPMEKTI